MTVTVILCTYNRCSSLAKALDSIAASTVPESVGWDVLVVDNNSTDRTREVVEGFCRRFPGRFNYLFEPQQGKSHALNAGVREARGDVLAFTDDDLTFEPTWLQNLAEAFRNGKWAGAGGRTAPERAVSLPRWLTLDERHVLAPLGVFDIGQDVLELTEPPFGNNMAYRRGVFQKYGGFRLDLGPRPGTEIRNEDTEFGRRLLAAGERLCYEPSAVAYHAVHENRLRKGFFLQWYFDYGRAMVREWESGPDILGVSRRCFTFFKYIGIVMPGKAFLWMVTLNPSRRFHKKRWVWATAGQIAEIRRQWQDAGGSGTKLFRRART
jgi:glycosyltransferase involved in cell wall biosynthesis